MIHKISQLIQEVIESLGYVGLALVLVTETLFPPIPSDVVLPLAGFFFGTGNFTFWGALLASTAGATVGALVLYSLGRWGGRALVLRYGKWLRVNEDDLDRAEGWFARHGDLVVLGARVVPGARSVVSIPAGTSRMPLLRFAVLTTIGSAVWNAVLIGAGVILGANWDRVSGWVGSYSDVVLAVVVAAAILYLVIRRFRRRKSED